VSNVMDHLVSTGGLVVKCDGTHKRHHLRYKPCRQARADRNALAHDKHVRAP
jgi:hypothetical protein